MNGARLKAASGAGLVRVRIANWELKTENFKLAGGVRRGSLQTLLVGVGCCEVLGLLSGGRALTQGSTRQGSAPPGL